MLLIDKDEIIPMTLIIGYCFHWKISNENKFSKNKVLNRVIAGYYHWKHRRYWIF